MNSWLFCRLTQFLNRNSQFPSAHGLKRFIAGAVRSKARFCGYKRGEAN